MIRVSIIGAAGYSGAELVGLLAGHDEVELVGLFGSEARATATAAPQPFSEAHPRFRGIVDLPIAPFAMEKLLAQNPDVVFLATPHEVSHDVAPELLKHGIVVFDLSAAFRLGDPAAYSKYYGFQHAHLDMLSSAVYGLPELHAEAIHSADLIALPGCYPTSIVLPLAPLVSAGAVDQTRPVIADCVSGVSGAGRSPALKSMFCEVTHQPYGVLSHRHTPEICEHSNVDVIFTPHLGPFDRGIVSTIHATLTIGSGWSEEAIRAALNAAYGDEPFVRLLSKNVWPSVGGVRGTNFCDIGLAVDASRNHLIVVTAIDNLLKGAAGQAVQCLNIRFGFPQTTALLNARQEMSNA